MKKVLMVIGGNLILALAVNLFILPFDILSGGVAGIAVALKPIFHLPPNLVINTLVIALFLVGFVFLGKEFAINTFISSIVYPILLEITAPLLPVLDIDPILASLYGGLIAGAGIGMVMRVGASTGGMDIPPLILNKMTHIDVAKWVLIIDGLTVLLGVFTYGFEEVLVGLLSVFTTSIAIDKVLLLGGEQAKSVQIISQLPLQTWIDLIDQKLNRGCTILKAEGGYQRANRDIVMVVVSMKQYPTLIELVKETDETAFVITMDTTEVHGEGFSFASRV